MKNNINIYLASPRGFCAGVDRAIQIVEKAIKKFGPPIYVRHEIVHNKHVVESLKKKGVIFVEELNEINDKTRPVIFSAHGVPKYIPEEAKKTNIQYIDATCPLVSKVHREAEQLHKNGFKIILIGHENHPEVIGTMGQIPSESIDLIETKEQAERYKFNGGEKIAYITQTTLSVDETEEIAKILRKRFPKINSPVKEDICYATTNRQMAVKKIASMCDMFFVIGSKNSSNSLRLVEVAKKSGCKKSKLIDDEKKLPIREILECKNIGISSGASAPEFLVKNIIKQIEEKAVIKINEVETIKEEIYFKIPNNLN